MIHARVCAASEEGGRRKEKEKAAGADTQVRPHEEMAGRGYMGGRRMM